MHATEKKPQIAAKKKVRSRDSSSSSERRSSFDLPVHFSVADRRVSLPLRFDAQHPMARRIGVELCRIADEIEALFVGDERRPGESLIYDLRLNKRDFFRRRFLPTS